MRTTSLRVAVVVLAGGRSRRFGTDKLAHEVDGRTLLAHTLEALPVDAEIILVGPPRPSSRLLTVVREDPPGGGPAAALVRGLDAALEAGADLIATLPGDAPDAGPAALVLLDRLRNDPAATAVVGVDLDGREQPLQLALTRAAAAQIIAAAGHTQGADQSARALVRALAPTAVRCRVDQAAVFDIDDHDQLTAWRLAKSPAVEDLLSTVERHGGGGEPLVVALDGPSCAGKSILATALRLRTAACVIQGDDFYGTHLPSLTATEREALSDADVAAAVIDWRRLRDVALHPLVAGRPARFQPYDWSVDDGRLAAEKVLRPADLIIVEGVYSARPELADLVGLAIHLGVAPELRMRRYAERGNDPDWTRLWERGEAHYFAHLRPPESFDLRLWSPEVS
jgi:molybdopterin-guanine dinucleotide biosynthesis protein A/uridine kinase